MRFFLLAILPLILVSSVVAQDEVRATQFAFQRYKNTGIGRGTLIFDPANGGLLEWSIYDPVLTDKQHQLPFDQLGSLRQLAEDRFLICGRNSSTLTGYIQVLALDHEDLVISVERSQTYPSFFDPYRVAFNSTEGRLYLLESVSKLVAFTAWDGLSALPSHTSFGVAADTFTFPLLQDPLVLELAEGALNAGCYVTRLGAHSRIGGAAISLDAGGWQVDTVSPHPADPNKFYVDNRTIVPAKGPLRIQGPAGSYNIRDLETGSVVVSGSLAQSGVWQQVPQPGSGEFEPGHRHLIERSGVTSSEEFTPTVRYGEPLNAGGFSIRRKGLLTPASMFIGNLDFSVSAFIGYDSPPAAPRTDVLQVAVWVGARDAQGNDPVTLMGSTCVLNPFWISPLVNMTLDELRWNSAISFCVPIPNDPALLGVVFLFQVVAATPGGQVLGTDCFGSGLHSWGAQSVAAPTPAVQNKDEFLRALDLYREGKPSLSGSGQAFYRAALSAMRMQIRK